MYTFVSLPTINNLKYLYISSRLLGPIEWTFLHSEKFSGCQSYRTKFAFPYRA